MKWQCQRSRPVKEVERAAPGSRPSSGRERAQARLGRLQRLAHREGAPGEMRRQARAVDGAVGRRSTSPGGRAGRARPGSCAAVAAPPRGRRAGVPGTGRLGAAVERGEGRRGRCRAPASGAVAPGPAAWRICRSQRRAQPSRLASRRITPVWRRSCQGMPCAAAQARTRRSRAKVQALPVSSCDHRAPMRQRLAQILQHRLDRAARARPAAARAPPAPRAARPGSRAGRRAGGRWRRAGAR